MNRVYLTRRNLLSLLAKMDDPNSKRTIIKQDDAHPKYPSTPTMITAVEDDEYYDTSGREPGRMKEDEHETVRQ